MRRIKQIEGALVRKTLENEILKKAVDFDKAKKWITRLPVLPGDEQLERCAWRLEYPAAKY